MKQISKVFIAVGLGIMFLGGMIDAHLLELRSLMRITVGKKSGKRSRKHILFTRRTSLTLMLSSLGNLRRWQSDKCSMRKR